MNKKSVLTRLANLADFLDDQGYPKEAATVTNVMQKVAQYPGGMAATPGMTARGDQFDASQTAEYQRLWATIQPKGLDANQLYTYAIGYAKGDVNWANNFMAYLKQLSMAGPAGTAAAGAAPGTPAGTPAAGTPAAGTPAAGTPAAGTPAAGTPAAGTPAAGTPGTATGYVGQIGAIKTGLLNLTRLTTEDTNDMDNAHADAWFRINVEQPAANILNATNNLNENDAQFLVREINVLQNMFKQAENNISLLEQNTLHGTMQSLFYPAVGTAAMQSVANAQKSLQQALQNIQAMAGPYGVPPVQPATGIPPRIQ